MELLAKLSLKGMNAAPKKNSLNEGESKNVAIIYGRASKYEVGQSTFGDYTKFKGTFEGQNLEDSKEYKSSALFLPPIAEGILQDAIDNAKDNTSVDFACMIGVRYADNSAGYEYTYEPLTEAKQSDQLGSLRKTAHAALASTSKPEATKGDAKTTKGK